MITCFERASWIAQVFLQELEKVSTLLIAASIERPSCQAPPLSLWVTLVCTRIRHPPPRDATPPHWLESLSQYTSSVRVRPFASTLFYLSI